MLRVNMSKSSKHIIGTLSDLKCHNLGKYGGNLSMAKSAQESLSKYI